MLTLLFVTGYGQSGFQTVQWVAPFGGLNVQQDRFSIGDKEFTTFNNGFLDGLGQIHKRGAYATLYTTKIDSNTSTSNGPVNALYRFYQSNGNRKLLANYLGGSHSSAQFSLWYQDSTSGWYQRYSAAPDTVSQIMYNDGTISTTASNPKIRGSSTNFFLNSGNQCVIKLRANGTAINLASQPKEIFVVNDTLLDLGDGVRPDSTSSGRKYELWMRSAHSGNSSFFTMATSYLDTVYFTRSIYDPMGWDGTKTVRVNVVDHGTADTLRDSTLVMNNKAWGVNDYSGLWLMRRLLGVTSDTFGYYTNWNLIKSNTATRLTLTDTLHTQTSKEFAIVSLPIDENIVSRTTVSTGVFSSFLDTILTNPAYKFVLRGPLYLLTLTGRLQGKIFYINGIESDSFWLNNKSGFRPTNSASTPSDWFGSTVSVKQPRFPIAKIILPFHERILWISDTIFQNSFWWSQPTRPGYIKPNDFSVINPNDGEVVQAAFLVNDDRVAFGKESKLYALVAATIETSGDDPALWQIRQISDKRGVSSQKSVVQRGGNTWFYDWPDGFFSITDLQKTISEPIRPLVDSINSAARDKVVGTYYPSKKGDFILWAIPVGSATMPNRVICYSVPTGAWSQWMLTNSTSAVSIASMLVKEGQGDDGEMLWGLSDSGYVLRYLPEASVDTLDGQGTGETKIFSLELESKRFAPEDGSRIRFRQFDFSATTGGSSTINFDFYKNASTTSLLTNSIASLSGLVNQKKSIADAVIGNQLSWKITTVSAQTFRLGRFSVYVQPAGRRMAQ